MAADAHADTRPTQKSSCFMTERDEQEKIEIDTASIYEVTVQLE
jgi:hypothetical protein